MTVKVECGAEVEVEGVTEPSKCEYVARVKSPAVCEWKEDKKEGAQQA